MARQKRTWVLVLLVVAICSAAAIVWMVRQHDNQHLASSEDCAVVAQLAREWTATAAADNDSVASDAPLPVGDRWMVMSDKARAAADSVSTPELKRDLNHWAQGFALFAQLDRDSSTQPPQGHPDELTNASEAGRLIYNTADRLRGACPNAWPSQDGG